MLSITTELGRFEEFFSDVVYPVWPLWLAVGIAAFAAALFLSYRMGWHRVAGRHVFLSSMIGAVLVAGVGSAGYYTISPLFDRNTVCEASPIPGADAGSEKCGDDVAIAATMPPSASPTEVAPTTVATNQPIEAAAPTATPFMPHEVQSGEFVSADDFHYTYGTALLIETEPGRYTLRFEDFSARNGPDVFVLLSPENGYTEAALNLGEMKGTDGAFNSEVPAGTDVSQYTTVVIWCREFDVVFGTAVFAPA